MNIKFIFVVALLGMFLVQGTQAMPRDLEKGFIDNIIKKCQEWWETIKNALTSFINSITEKLSGLLGPVKKKIEEILAQVKAKVGEIIDKLKGKIGEAIKEAQELGVDISDCVKDEKENFDQLLQSTLSNLLGCAKKELDAAEQIVSDAKEVIAGVWKDMQTIPSKWENCQNGYSISSVLGCVVEVIKEIVSMEKDVPAKLNGVIQNATQLISGIQIRLVDCGKNAVVDATIEAGKITSDIVGCIANKTNQHEIYRLEYLI